MHHTRNVAVHLRGRAALAGALAVTGSERTARLRLARSCATQLGRGGGWGGSMAALLHAGIAHAEGNATESATWLRRAIDETGAHQLGLFKAAAQMAAAQLAGDAETAAAGEAWMHDNGAKAPRPLARMLVPGLR
jgi:hypothetical protein